MGINGRSGQGCTHHVPLCAYITICCPGRAFLTRPAIVSVFSRPPCAAAGILVSSIDGLAPFFGEWHPCAAKPKAPIRISVHASFFGATLTARPAVPRGYLLASMSDPKLLALMIPSLGTLNKPQWRLLWGNPKGHFMI